MTAPKGTSLTESALASRRVGAYTLQARGALSPSLPALLGNDSKVHAAGRCGY